MTVLELKQALADVPDNFEVGVEVVLFNDTEFVPFEGPSDLRWDHGFALVVKAGTKGLLR